jgi:hypothetical protein
MEAIMSRRGVAERGGLGALRFGLDGCGVIMVEVLEETLAREFFAGDREGERLRLTEVEDGGGDSSEEKKGTFVLNGVQLSEFFPGLSEEESGDPVTGRVTIGLGIREDFSIGISGDSVNLSLRILSD